MLSISFILTKACDNCWGTIWTSSNATKMRTVELLCSPIYYYFMLDVSFVLVMKTVVNTSVNVMQCESQISADGVNGAQHHTLTVCVCVCVCPSDLQSPAEHHAL